MTHIFCWGWLVAQEVVVWSRAIPFRKSKMGKDGGPIGSFGDQQETFSICGGHEAEIHE